MTRTPFSVSHAVQKLAFATAFTLAGSVAGVAQGADVPNPNNWQDVLTAAEGQTVYFNAWGGAPNINNYIAGSVKRLAPSMA